MEHFDAVVHTDTRRELVDFAFDFNIRSLKVIKSFKCQDLGNHFHKKKTELFFLVHGVIKSMNINGVNWGKQYAPFAWRVDPNEFHSILPEEGAIIVCLSDHIYDPTDEVVK